MKRNTERQMGALIRRDADVKKYTKQLKANDNVVIKNFLISTNKKYEKFNEKELQTVMENKLKTARVDVLNLKTKLITQSVDVNKLLGEEKEKTE